MGYDQYTVPWHCSCRTYFCCFPLALTNIRPWPLVPFFQISLKNSELKTTHNTLSRVLFPTTFLEALYNNVILHLTKIGNSFVFWKCSCNFSLIDYNNFSSRAWGKQWKQLMNVHETQVSINRKNLLRAHIIWNRYNVLLQVSSHVTSILMSILFVLRQKSEQSLDRCVHVFFSFAIDFICVE